MAKKGGGIVSGDNENVAARSTDFEQSGVCPDCLFLGESTIDPMTHRPIGNISHNDYATTIQYMANGCEVAKFLETSLEHYRIRNIES